MRSLHPCELDLCVVSSHTKSSVCNSLAGLRGGKDITNIRALPRQDCMYQGGIPPPLRTWIPTQPPIYHPASPAVSPQVRRAGPKATNANTAREQHRLDLHDASCSLLSPSRVAPPSSYRATRRSSLAARRTEGTAVLPPRALPTASITGQYTVAQFFSPRRLPYFLQLGTKLATLAWDGVSTERRWWRVARRSSSYALDQSVAA